MFEFFKRILKRDKTKTGVAQSNNNSVLVNDTTDTAEMIKSIRQKQVATFEQIRMQEDAEFVSSVDSSKYLVLDVETNGLASKRDDLLSIAIYMPDTGKIYHRLLPLELNSTVKTTYINGITDRMLEGTKPLSQLELDNVIEEYDVENRTTLMYGNFDEKYIKTYLSRHNLKGIEKFHFYNFKRDIISSRFSEGNITKDNLCKLFHIDNVNDVHSADNDCILEWKLYERMNGGQLLVTSNKVFEFNKGDYIVPASYIANFPNFKYHLPPLPKIRAEATVVKQIRVEGSFLKKFGSNVDGIVIENQLNKMIAARPCNSLPFLINNKSKLNYIGELESRIDCIPIAFKEDGTVITFREQDKKIGGQINSFIETIRSELVPIVEYIKTDIFRNKEILWQELVINQEANILALCDLSSEDAVLEIKATDFRDANAFAQQMYYESKGRDTYIFQVDWGRLPKELRFIISKIKFEVTYPEKEDNATKFEKAKQAIETDEIELIRFVNKSQSVRLRCKTCGYEWDTGYYTAVKKKPCKRCHPRISREPRVNENLLKQERANNKENVYNKKVYDRSKGTIVAENYTGSKNPVNARCLKCGYEWTTRADHLLERCYCNKCSNRN